VDLRDGEQLHYFQAFRDEFEGCSSQGCSAGGSTPASPAAAPPPEGQLACTTCGEYPARRLTKLVMEGWEGKAVEEKDSPALATEDAEPSHAQGERAPRVAPLSLKPFLEEGERRGRQGSPPCPAHAPSAPPSARAPSPDLPHQPGLTWHWDWGLPLGLAAAVGVGVGVGVGEAAPLGHLWARPRCGSQGVVCS